MADRIVQKLYELVSFSGHGLGAKITPLLWGLKLFEMAVWILRFLTCRLERGHEGARLFSVSAMEASQSLSIDSFSYSWLENRDNSYRASFDASDDVSFIEMDPNMPPSKRFFNKSQDFMFDFHVSPSAQDFVHADQLISDGYLVPLFFYPVKIETLEKSDSVPDPCDSPRDADEDRDSNCSWLKNCRKISKQVFQKYLNFLIPLCRRISGVETSSKAVEFGLRCHSVKSLKRVYTSETSPEMSIACSINDRRQSLGSESSIYDAVLHCKKSIGK